MKPVNLTGRVEVKCSRCNWKGTSPQEWGATICPKCMYWIMHEKAPVKPGSSTRATLKKTTDQS